jgi:uncharacterized membrane protein
MLRFLEVLLGAPLTRETRDGTFRAMAGDRSPRETADFLRWGAGHNTEKSGALLGAQAIFVVVATFVLERGWPKTPTLASLFLLLAAALLLMTNLRSTTRAWRLELGAEGQNRHMFNMNVSRTIRFNIALYLTFLAIIFLAFGAISLAG